MNNIVKRQLDAFDRVVEFGANYPLIPAIAAVTALYTAVGNAAIDIRGHKTAFVRRAQNGAAERHDSRRGALVQDHRVGWRQQSLKSVAESDDLPAQLVGRPDGTSNYGIQTWAVAPARQYSDTSPLH
jgi:hypothetical protein